MNLQQNYTQEECTTERNNAHIGLCSVLRPRQHNNAHKSQLLTHHSITAGTNHTVRVKHSDSASQSHDVIRIFDFINIIWQQVISLTQITTTAIVF